MCNLYYNFLLRSISGRRLVVRLRMTVRCGRRKMQELETTDEKAGLERTKGHWKGHWSGIVPRYAIFQCCICHRARVGPRLKKRPARTALHRPMHGRKNSRGIIETSAIYHYNRSGRIVFPTAVFF